MRTMSFTDIRNRKENYSPTDIILSATTDTISRRVYSPYGTLGLRGPNGGVYAYDHWDIEHIDEHTDRVTVYLVEIGKEE